MIEYTPAWSPDGARIAYVSGGPDTDGGDIFVLELATLRASRITTPAVRRFEHHPTWSPNGAKIAYSRPVVGQPDAYRIYVMRSGGSPPVQLTTDQSSWPSWSPNSDAIVFSSRRGMALMNADGTDQRLIYSGVGHRPHWGGY